MMAYSQIMKIPTIIPKTSLSGGKLTVNLDLPSARIARALDN